MENRSEGVNLEFVGLVPAAGKARRLGLSATAKELVPLLELEGDGEPRLKAACDVLLERLASTPVERLVVVIDPEKGDLLLHLGERSPEPPLALVPRGSSPSLVHSLAAALPFVGGRRVLLGFPDVLFEPTDALHHLRLDLESHDADLCLGLFPASDCRTTDMVGHDESGRVTAIEVRPATTSLHLAWALAAWGPRLSALIQAAASGSDGSGSELQLGSVFQTALAAGLRARAVPFEQGRFLDLGTPQGWLRLRRERGWLGH